MSKNNIIISIILYVFTPVCFAANAKEWLLYKTFYSSEINNQLVIVDDNNIDIDIKLINNKVVSIQNSPGGLESKDYLVIEKSNKKLKYKLFIRATYNTDFELKVNLSIKNISSSNELIYYKKFHEIASEWFRKNDSSTSLILNKARKLYIENKQTKFRTEALLIYTQILYYLERYREIINEIGMIDLNDLDNIELKRKLEFILITSNSNLNNFSESLKLNKILLDDLEIAKNLDLGWVIIKERLRSFYGLNKSVYSFHNNNLNHLGKKHINDALDNSINIGDYKLTSDILKFLAVHNGLNKKWNDALANLFVAEEYIKKSNLYIDFIELYNSIAVIYYLSSDLKKAQFYYRKALYIANKYGKLFSEASIFLNLARTYEIIGDYERSLRYNKSSLKIYEELGVVHEIGIVKKILGRIERNKGNFQSALQYHHNSISDFKDNSVYLFIGVIAELSKDYLNFGKNDLAKKYALISLIINHIQKLSLEFNKQDYESVLISERLTIVSDIYDYYLQLTGLNLNSIIKISKKLDLDFPNSSENTFLSLFVLAKLSLISKQKNEVNLYLLILKDLLSYKTVPLDLKLEFIYFKLSYLSIEYNSQQFNNFANESMHFINNIRAKFDVSDLALYWTNQAKSILNIYIDALITQGKYQQLFELLEKYYAINLRDKRQNTTDKIIKEKSKEIQLALDSYITLERETLLTDDKDKQSQADEAKEHFLELNATDIKPRKKIELDYLSIKQVQDNLREKELFVRYYLNDNNALAFIIDKHSWKVLNLPANAILKENVKTVLNNIKSKSFRKLKANDALLTDILPLNLISSQKYEKLIIIPDGVLNLLPFGTINISQDEGQYQPLASNLIIERAYSASDYFTSIELPQQNTHSISIFANPVFLNQVNNDEIMTQFDKNNRLWEFTALPYTKTDAEEIVSIFPDYEINLLTGNKATNENFMAAENRNANIIHIATHGFFNESNIEDVGIATSIVDENNQLSAGVLAMREVLFKPFTSNLVVISGCETTLGKEINGEGFNSLSRGLLSQGVGSVIGTIWSISDRATPEFMQTFYTNLKQEQGNVPLALKLTKQSFITDSRFRRYRHPYYWAGFVLTSSNRSISENIF